MSRKRTICRQFYPKSLTGQLMVSLLLALVVAHLVSFFILADERHGAIAAAQRDQVLARTASIARILAETPVEQHQRIADVASTLQLRFFISPESGIDGSDVDHSHNRFARRLTRLLERDDGQVLVAVQKSRLWDWTHDTGSGEQRSMNRLDGERRWRYDEDEEFDDEEDDDHHHQTNWHDRHHVMSMSLAVQMANGQWLNADYRIFGSPRGWARATFLTIALVGVAVCLVTFLMLRRLTRPLKDLATAAETFGRGESPPPLDETGPLEIQRTTAAFNHMKQRLRRFVDDRTAMLAAISHDLRTPLTTLRLRAEMLKDDETKQKILETLDEMKRMTEATLAFASDEATREETRVIDLAALIESIVLDHHDMGHSVSFEKSSPLAYRCRPSGLKRALRNLIENAVRYGETVTVRLEEGESTIVISIEDDGPGIPEAARDHVFEPFVRLEESRSKETGGIGLGLAIARTIIRAHGGDISLDNRPEGGLLARIELPQAPLP